MAAYAATSLLKTSATPSCEMRKPCSCMAAAITRSDFPSARSARILTDGGLFSLIRHELAAAQFVLALHDAVAKLPLASEMPPAFALFCFGLCHAGADAVALGFGDGTQDREHKLGDTIAGDVAAPSRSGKAQRLAPSSIQVVERIKRTAEHAVELG